jgi:glycosyltransferase involved in cell wall biosynthesis
MKGWFSAGERQRLSHHEGAVRDRINQIDKLLDQGFGTARDDLISERRTLVNELKGYFQHVMSENGLTDGYPHNMTIVVIAPNVSERMGGEAMKALRTYRALKALRPNTSLITHERNREEVKRLQLPDVTLVKDTPFSIFLWRTVLFRYLLDYWFATKAVRLAMRTFRQERETVIYQVEPNSPVLPRVVPEGFTNVLGPINGNIYYPAMSRPAETLKTRLRRVFHFPAQRLNKVLFPSMARADLILTAGGERTRRSLLARGCAPEILVDSIDCGIDDSLLDRPRIRHEGYNPRFVHFGRLVFHKCTFLIIEALAKTSLPIQLDVIGSGPELSACKALTAQLKLDSRVNFKPPFTRQSDLFDALGAYRALILPSIEDANGMVVQEAMAIGLPPVCLDWGGPRLLIQHQQTGYLIPPVSREQVTSEMADRLVQLARDDSIAEAFSVAGRERAQAWRWSETAKEWVSHLERAARTRELGQGEVPNYGS